LFHPEEEIHFENFDMEVDFKKGVNRAIDNTTTAKINYNI
jgi:hypothetical protein